MKRKSEERLSRKRQSLRLGTCRAALAASAFMLIGTSAAGAQEIDADRFTFRGFGTLGAVTHDADGIEYRRNVSQAHGAEAHEIDFRTDSLAGLQFDAKLASHFDVALQAVTRQNVEGNWSPRLTQGFLRYSPDESLVIRAGRIGYEIYLLAESRQVGYSYVAVRPSPEFYGLVTNDEVDGMDVSWTGRVGRGLFKARVFGGESSDETAMADGTYWKATSDALGVALDYTYRSWTARAAMLRVSYGSNRDLRSLGEFLVSTGVPQSVAIGGELARSSQESRGMQLGVAYDDGPLQAQLLFGHIISDSISGPNVDAYQAQVGYRLGEWTPFASYARSRDRHAIRDPGLPPLPELQPVIDSVRAMQANMRATQHSSSLGVRWDFRANWALKFQADFASLHDSTLNFDRRPAGSPDAHMTVLTATLDLVF